MPETYTNYATKLNNTTETTILTPPAGGTSLVNGIHISNILPSTNLSATVNLYKGATSYSIITSGLVPIQSSFQVLDTPIPVTSGDLIKAQASASGLHVVVSTLELT
jgi:hypothetical protein